jgi:hypothetical protein
MPKITEPVTCVSSYRTTEIREDFYPISVSPFSVPPAIVLISERSKNLSYFVPVAATAHRRGEPGVARTDKENVSADKSR